MTMTQDAMYQPGEQCGDYRIVRLLGSGGYADVFKAMHVATGEVVALKRLKPQHVNNARAKERFLAEARLFAKIQHANVVRVTRVGSEQGLIWMAMEFLDGGTLRDVLKAKEGPLPAVQALYFGREVADGVAALHEERVVHRDLKPENIMVTEAGAVKVLDAGAAKFFGWDVQSTGPLGAVGTPLYMAPEHILGEPVDVRTDVYALGLILYEMLAGHHAFARDAGRQASQLDIIAWQLHAVPPPLVEVIPQISASVSALVERAMAKKPHDRFGSMPELAKALRVEWKRCLEAGQAVPEVRLSRAPRLEEGITTDPRQQMAQRDAPTRKEPGGIAVEAPRGMVPIGEETVTVPVRSARLSSPEMSGEAGLSGDNSEGRTAPLPGRCPSNGTEPLWVGSLGPPLGVALTERQGRAAKMPALPVAPPLRGSDALHRSEVSRRAVRAAEPTTMTASVRSIASARREPVGRPKRGRVHLALTVLLASAASMGMAVALVLGVRVWSASAKLEEPSLVGAVEPGSVAAPVGTAVLPAEADSKGVELAPAPTGTPEAVQVASGAPSARAVAKAATRPAQKGGLLEGKPGTARGASLGKASRAAPKPSGEPAFILE
jgi:serine/threonine-protein kinase